MGKDGFLICDNFKGAVGTSQVPHNISIKIDHQWSSRSKYFFEWLYNPGKYRNYRIPWTGLTYPGPLVGFGSRVPLNFRNQIFGLGNTYTFTPTFFNEFHYNFSRQLLDAKTGTISAYDEIAALKQVEQEFAPLRYPSTQFYPVPNFQIRTPGGGDLEFGIPSWQSSNVMSEAHTFLDNLTKIIGRHTLKTGFVYRLEHAAWDSSSPTSLNFGGRLTRNPITRLGGGRGLAQFLLGAPDSGSGTGLWLGSYMRWRYWGAYFQDDFRVTPRFSLNVGLRWDMYGQLKARWHPNSNFCLDCINPLTDLPGKVIYEGDPELPKNHDFFPANKKNFGPRLNFAWTPFADQKTIIRGGYNIFTSNATNAINFPGQFSAPGWQVFAGWSGSMFPSQCAPLTDQCVPFRLSDTTTDKGSLTIPPLTAGFPAEKRDPFFGQSFFVTQKPSREPLVQLWGLQIERQLPGNMMLSLGYVGNHGTHLFSVFRNYNFVHTRDLLKYRTAINATIPITQVFTDPVTVNKLQEVYGSSELPRSLLLQTYPFFFPDQSASFDGTNIYHGMNLRIQKKYSHGLNFNVAYTVSKNITNAVPGNLGALLVDPIHPFADPGGRADTVQITSGLYQDADNRRDRVIAVDDVSQILNVFGSYELPFGNGKPFLNRKGILNGILGGWKLAANFNAQTGIPLGVDCPANGITARCNLIGSPKFSGNRSKEQRIAQWINPAAFEPPFGSDPAVIQAVSTGFYPDGTPFNFDSDLWWRFGTAGPRMSSLRSPGFWNVDSTLSKRFSISESKYFEFRWEVFNALNHQNLGLPNTSYCLPPLPDGTTDVIHQDGCTFGRITNIATDARSMEFGLKFFW